MRGRGHLDLVHEVMETLFAGEFPALDLENVVMPMIENQFTMRIIIDYISEILINFIKTWKAKNLPPEKFIGHFIATYYKNIFLKNIDIWGWVMVQLPMFEALDDANMVKYGSPLFLLYKETFLYLYTTTSLLDIDKLQSLITSINSHLGFTDSFTARTRARASFRDTLDYDSDPIFKSSKRKEKQTRRAKKL